MLTRNKSRLHGYAIFFIMAALSFYSTNPMAAEASSELLKSGVWEVKTTLKNNKGDASTDYAYVCSESDNLVLDFIKSLDAAQNCSGVQFTPLKNVSFIGQCERHTPKLTIKLDFVRNDKYLRYVLERTEFQPSKESMTAEMQIKWIGLCGYGWLAGMMYTNDGRVVELKIVQ